MAKVALVLSGGGAKGAFQLMAEKYAREEKGYKWDIIAGVSVGALNGLMLAMEKYQRMEEIWQTITSDKVYTGKFNFWGIARLIFGAKSILGNEPLRKLLEQEIDLERIKVDLRIGAVSLQTGQYKHFVPADPGFEKAVLASTAIPILWPPEDVSPAYPSMVDGGVRNVSPLGDVLDSNPDEIIIINCSPQEPSRMDKSFKNALDIGKAALEIALNEIFITDVREFVRINRNVEDAAAQGVTLHKEDGTEFKFYKHSLIEPDEPLGDTLDFSSTTIKRSMEAGWEKAKQVLG